MKMHQVAASILCMALLLALCLSAAYSEEIIPFAESGNNVQAILRFSNGKAISDGRVAKLEAGCTASTTVYVQAKSGSGWTTKRWPGSKRFLHSAKGYGIPRLCRCNDL